MTRLMGGDRSLCERLRVTADVCDDLRHGRDPFCRLQEEWRRLSGAAEEPGLAERMELLRRVSESLGARGSMP